MNVDPVTARYVEALFRLALRRGELDAVGRDVDRLAAGCPPHVFDARIELEKRRALLGATVDGLSELTRNFVNLLFDKRREDVLKHLAAAWRRRMLDERGAVEGVVESARPLDAAQVDGLAATLGARLQKEVLLRNEVVPELVGGVRVVVAGKLLDASVKGRLEGLRKTLLEAPLSAASA